MMNKMQEHSNNSVKVKTDLAKAKIYLSEKQKALKAAQEAKSGVEEAEAAVKVAKEAVQAAKANVGFGKLTSRLSNTNTGKYISNLTKDGIGQIVKNIKASKDSAGLLSNLSKDAQAVIKLLQSDKCTYYDAVRQFGYENVLEALEAFAGARLTDQTV